MPSATAATATTLPSPLCGGGSSLGSGVSAQAARLRSESVDVTGGAIASVGAAGSARLGRRDGGGAPSLPSPKLGTEPEFATDAGAGSGIDIEDSGGGVSPSRGSATPSA